MTYLDKITITVDHYSSKKLKIMHFVPYLGNPLKHKNLWSFYPKCVAGIGKVTWHFVSIGLCLLITLRNTKDVPG